MRNTSILSILALTVLALLGNRLNLSLLLGIEFIFGSIFILLILRIYGMKWALAASLLANGYTLILWHHPYAWVVFLLETLVVGLLYRGKRLVLADVLYWLLIGMPLVWVFYRYALNMNDTASFIIVLKDAVNGILNALIASLIITYLPLMKWPAIRKRKLSSPFHEVLFHLFVTLIFVSLIAATVLIGRQQYSDLQEEIKSETAERAADIRDHIVLWGESHIAAVNMLATAAAESGDRQESLQRQAASLRGFYPDYNTLYIAGRDGTTTVFHPSRNQAGEPTIGLNFADRPYFAFMKERRLPVVSEVFEGRGGVTGPLVIIGSPVLKDGVFQGAAVGGLDLAHVTSELKTFAGTSRMHVTIVDRNNRVVASTRGDLASMDRYDGAAIERADKAADSLYLRYPDGVKNPMKRLAKSSYYKILTIPQLGDWQMIAETPIAPYRDRLYAFYIRIFAVLLACGLLSIAVSNYLSRLIVRPIRQLTDNTTNLPEKIANDEIVSWNGSCIEEINTLISNSKDTASRLQGMFAEIRQLAYYDSLTGLPNRVCFTQRLQDYLGEAGALGHTAAVFFIDLDRFKMVNDTIGHAGGDLLLKDAADRLRTILGGRAILSRTGGDEFIALLPQVSREEAEDAARDILRAFKTPVPIMDREVYTTPSIGIVMYPADGTSETELVKNADQAMYLVKEDGRNGYRFYEGRLNMELARKMSLETMLHKALDNGEFELFYQPRMDLTSGRIIGLEALIRWRHPVQGMISPADFIPIAEESGLIRPIGEWVLRTACAQNKAWQQEGYEPLCVSVNLSVRQFKDEHLVRGISGILRETGLDPRYLELEITENISMNNEDHVLSTLRRIRDLGVKISIDDFGTGYSSLNYLKKFPIDYLKIDQSFVRNIRGESDDVSIVKAIINIARSMGLKVVAEGVETQNQLALLRELDCNEAQGYLISKPLDREGARAFFAKRQ